MILGDADTLAAGPTLPSSSDMSISVSIMLTGGPELPSLSFVSLMYIKQHTIINPLIPRLINIDVHTSLGLKNVPLPPTPRLEEVVVVVDKNIDPSKKPDKRDKAAIG